MHPTFNSMPNLNKYIVKQKHLLTILTLLIGLSSTLFFLHVSVAIDSYYDLVFEANTLLVVAYVYFIAKPALNANLLLLSGLRLLIFNKIYDVVTEIDWLDKIADQHEFIDTLLEDGMLQLSFLLIAFGLTKQLRQVHENAARDELTGLYTRKNFDAIRLEMFDLIYLDLDGLKEINDKKGHAVGDLAIVRFATALESSLEEKNGSVFRLGGDEFAVVVTVGTAKLYLDSLIKTLEGEQLSFSFGVAQGTKETLKEALHKADQEMYKMKSSQE